MAFGTILNPDELLDAIRKARNGSSTEMQQGLANAASGGVGALQQMQAQQRQSQQDALAAQKQKAVLSSQDLQDHLAQIREEREATYQHSQAANDAVNAENQREDRARNRQIQDEAAQSAASQRAEAVKQKQRDDALARVNQAMAAHLSAHGPNADITPVMNDLAGQPGLESIRPEDVMAAHWHQVIDLAQKSRDEGKAQQKIDEEARHNKATEGIEWQRNKNALDLEKMKLDAGDKKAAGKANDASVETMLQKKAFIASLDKAIGILGDKSKQVDLNKIAYNRKAQAITAHSDSPEGVIAGFAGQRFTQLNPDETELAATLTTGMERGTGAISGAHRALAEKSKTTLDQAMTGGQLSPDDALVALKSARAAAAADLAEHEAALPAAGARITAIDEPVASAPAASSGKPSTWQR